MKTIGLLGGVSWHSTLEYYRLINELTNKKLGGYHSSSMLIYSFNFDEIRELQSKSEELLCKRLIKESQNLEKSGAQCILIGANTLHIHYEKIESSITIPIIHVADAVSNCIRGKGLKKVGLLGTALTMEENFYINRLKMNNIETFVPDKKDRKIINEIIFNELVNGIVSETSKAKFQEIINILAKTKSIEGVILGCTEIPLLIQEKDLEIPSFNSTEIHANEAVCFAIGE